MIFALISIIFMIGIIYRSEFGNKDKAFWLKYKKLIALIGITVIPILLINILGTSGNWITAEENLEEANEFSGGTDLMAAYEYQLMATPDSVPLYFEYVEACRVNLVSKCTYIDFERFTRDPEILKIATLYARIVCEDKEPFVADEFDVKLDENSTKFYNYVNGVSMLHAGNVDEAQVAFERELAINPTYTDAYVALYEVYSIYKHDQLEDFILDSKYAQGLPRDILNFEYFRLGAYSRYIDTIVQERFYNIGYIAFIAGLGISLIWIFFLSRMNKELPTRWGTVLVVFLGGVLFANICLPFYDYAHFVLHFRIEGTFWNDLGYCIAVIGGSEEFVKMLPWVIFALLFRRMKEPFDYILYASIAALGFAFAENWVYLEDAENIVARSIMSTMSHMFDASIVAYGFMLSRYKMKSIGSKILTPILAFILAAIMHGFYDFWLISPSVEGAEFITVFFFIFTIHFWFSLQKHTIAHVHRLTKKGFRSESQLNILMFSVLGLMMVEYIIISVEHGYGAGNLDLGGTAWIVAFFLVYMSFILINFTSKKGWNPFKIPLPATVTGVLGLPPFDDGEEVYEDEERELIIGKVLRLSAPKTNPHIGRLMPVEGECVKEFTMGGANGWYLFNLKKPFGLANYEQEQVIVKCKSEDESLTQRKVEIYFLLIPKGVKVDTSKPQVMRDYRYLGRVYSSPV